MNALARQGALLGFRARCWLAWSGCGRRGTPHGLDGRVVPYVRDAPAPSRLLRDRP